MIWFFFKISDRFLLRFFKCMVQNEDGNMNMRSGFVGKFNINGKCYDISSATSELSSTVMLRVRFDMKYVLVSKKYKLFITSQFISKPKPTKCRYLWEKM